MSVLRGRPPGLAGGISGSKRRNWSSVRAWPAPKSPTSARSAGVHMAVPRQETASNAAFTARISPSNQARRPSQTGTEPGDGSPVIWRGKEWLRYHAGRPALIGLDYDAKDLP